jgi:hypothetical protein
VATEALDHEQPVPEVEAAPPAAPGGAPRWVPPLVAGLCAVTLALRTLIGLHSGLWRDEALFLFVVDEPSWAAMVDVLRQHESHPPLFYAVMRVWLSLVGDSDGAALTVPVLFGAALVPALYAVGARLLSWRAGLIAAAAGALSPVLAMYATVVRPYSLLPLLALGSTYALARAIDLGGRRRWAGYAAATLGLVYTHNWAWLVVGAQWVVVAACLWRGVPRPRAAVVRGWAGAQAAVAIGFLPWLPSFAHQSEHAGYASFHLFGGVATGWDAITAVIALAGLLLSATLSPIGMSALPTAAVVWALGVSALAVVIRGHPVRVLEPAAGVGPPSGRTTRTILVCTPLAATCAAVLLSPRSNLLVPHCLAMLAPLLLLVVGDGLDRWAARGQRRLAGTAVAALLAGYAALLPSLYQEPRSNARELAGAVASQARPSDLMVISPWWLSSSFNRYYAPTTEQIDFPALGRVGVTPYDDEVRRLGDPGALAEAERRIAASRAAGRRIWFVSEPGARACADARCDATAPDPGNFTDLGALRADQLRAYVTSRYGGPDRCDTYAPVAPRLELLTACLFVPR